MPKALLITIGLLVLSRWGIAADTLTDFRVRTDFTAPLNADGGWAAAPNEPAEIAVDRPFRLRVQVQSPQARDRLRHYRLEFRHDRGPWQPVMAADFPYPKYASPVVSVVGAPFAAHEHTTDLLPGGDLEHGEDGTGIDLSPITGAAGEAEVSNEWEWPLVVRGIADGPVFVRDGDAIEFRLVEFLGRPVARQVTPAITVRIPDRHLSGTYVESPGRIGPWQTADDNLYFIMEPTETDNRFMMMRSTTAGSTWAEADGDHRPDARDLEAVDGVVGAAVIHIVHQEDVVWYHAFATSDHATAPDRWLVRSELVAEPAKPPVQSVAIARRSSGELVACHADGPRLVVRKRVVGGGWPQVQVIAAGRWVNGIQAVTDRSDRIHLVYTTGDGQAWTQVLDTDDTLQAPQLLSDRMGEAEADVGSVLPPVLLAGRDQVVFVMREASGRLFERRLELASGELGPKHRISDMVVVQNAVDSDQTAATLVARDDRLQLLMIDEAERNIHHVSSSQAGVWTEPRLLVDRVDACWIRAQVLRDGRVAYVYDAGSRGGAGMNRFGIVAGR